MMDERKQERKNNKIHLIVITMIYILAIISVFDFFYNETKTLLNRGVSSPYVNQESFDSEIAVIGEQVGAVRTLLIGDDKDARTEIVKSQLANLKEDYILVSSFDEIDWQQAKKAQVYVVSTQLTSQEIKTLSGYLDEGDCLVFLNSLSNEALLDEEVQDLIGIERYSGEGEFEGFRVSGDLSFYSMLEQTKTKITADIVSVGEAVKKYAYALEEDEGNEELTPLMWRYIGESGRVYVLNNDIFEEMLGYGAITNIYSELQETYIYPIVNAYMFIVNSMPFADNYESVYLQEQYSRDAMNTQNSVFFSQFNSSMRRFGFEISWYSPHFEEVLVSSNKDLQYYLDEIEINGGEIAKNIDGELISVGDLSSELVMWSSGFSFSGGDNDTPMLPITVRPLSYEHDFIAVDAMAKSCGFISIYTDVDDFLYDSGNDWVEYSLVYESILNYQAENYPWLDRVNVSEAARRALAFISIEPHYNYKNDAAEIFIKNFEGQAFFVVMTKREVQTAQGATITEIGDGVYLVAANSDYVNIIYKD